MAAMLDTSHLSPGQLDAIAEYGLDLEAEGWVPKAFPVLAAPGQLFPPERYTERFAAMEAELARGFHGITTDGNVVRGLYGLEPTGISIEPIRHAACAYLDSLTEDQRRRAVLPVDTLDWQRWHGLFTRLLRHGLALEEMTPAQKQAALALLRATLSAEGYAAVEGIRRTNQLAGAVSGRYKDLGEDQFWLSVMGDPRSDAAWGWQFDGHHINLNCMVVGDQLVLTPAYLGAEPTRVRTGRFAGLSLFEPEVERAVALMTSLDAGQRREAVIATTLQMEVFTGCFRDNFELAYQGAAARAFTAEQRERLVHLIEAYTRYIRPGHAEVRRAEVLRHLDETHFAWMGGFQDAEAFYYRVHSPVVLIEFNHMPGISLVGEQPSRNHVHTVVRTPNGNDYGKDLLRQHMEQAHLSR